MNFVSQASVVSIKEIQPDIREYVLDVENVRRYNPGSFVQLSLKQVTASEIWPDSRTFSIASWEGGRMRFIIQRVGSYTSRIFNELQVGGKCTIKYPYGDMFDKKRINEQHLFVAGGVGITPFLGLSKYFFDNGLISQVRLLYSVKTAKDLIEPDFLSRVFGDRLSLFITREAVPGSFHRRIAIDDVLAASDTQTNVYICGSKEFNDCFARQLREAGYAKILMDEWE